MSTTTTSTTQQARQHKENAVVPPQIEVGFAPRVGIVAGGIVALGVVQSIVHVLVKDSKSFTPAEHFCKDQSPETCARPDLFGFQVASGCMMIFMASMGFSAWHWTKRAHIYQTPEGRCFGYLKEADYLNTGVLIFQLWNFLASLRIPEHATFVFLSHHILAALCSWFTLQFQMVHHYSIFYGGCSEISSLFLVICDFDVYFPANQWSSSVPLWGTIVFVCQASFTLGFLYYRIVYWWVYSRPLWSDVAHVTKSTTKSGRCIAEEYRPGKTWLFLYFFLAMDVVLGLLQVYWFGYGIVPKIVEILE